MEDPLVHLNGEMLPLSQARVSVLDRGFIFGDGVYEVLPVYSRRPFRLAQHLARLRASLAETRIRDPYTPAQWEALFDGVIAANPRTRTAASTNFEFPCLFMVCLLVNGVNS